MQKLVKAAKEGTKDGLEKTKAAVKKGRSYIKTKSFCHGTHKTLTFINKGPFSDTLSLLFFNY